MSKYLRLFSFAGTALGTAWVVLPTRLYAACSGQGVTVSSALGVPNDCVGADGTNPIYALISVVITYATGVLGLIMILMIVIAGLQYVVSNGSPDTAKAARQRIENVVTGFILFVLMWGILQALLPPDARIFQ